MDPGVVDSPPILLVNRLDINQARFSFVMTPRDEKPVGLAYNPVLPDENEIAIHGILNARSKAVLRWSEDTATEIRDRDQYHFEQAHRHVARSNGLHEALDRAILLQDIRQSGTVIQTTIAENILILCLMFEQDYNSPDVQGIFGCDVDELLDDLQFSLHVSGQARRPKREEAHATSLIRVFFEASDGRVDDQQHGFDEDFTTVSNADLYASMIGITRTRSFGDYNAQEVCQTLMRSAIFAGRTIGVEFIQQRIEKLCVYLPIVAGYLDLPQSISNRLGWGHVDTFKFYVHEMYRTIPSLRQPGNNLLLLLTWSATVSTRQAEILSGWAISGDGQGLYKKMLRDLSVAQSAARFVLTVAALVAYHQLIPDLSGDAEEPVPDSQLDGLDALLQGKSSENGRAVVDRLGSALQHVLLSMENQLDGHAEILALVIGREPPVPLVLDGALERYLVGRLDGLPHYVAVRVSPTFEVTDDHDMGWEVIALEDAVPDREPRTPDQSPNPVNLRAHQPVDTILEGLNHNHDRLKIDIRYAIKVEVSNKAEGEELTSNRVKSACYSVHSGYQTPPSSPYDPPAILVRLSEAGDDTDRLCKTISHLSGVISSMELGDESWELLVYRSRRYRLRGYLRRVFPGLRVDPSYNPIEPSAEDVERWGYAEAKRICPYIHARRAQSMMESDCPKTDCDKNCGICYNKARLHC